MNRFCFYSVFVLMLIACQKKHKTVNNTFPSKESNITMDSTEVSEDPLNYKMQFKADSTFFSDGFDFPVGKPDAQGYYNAQKFQENNHLGDDWNGIGGGNSDLGDAIYSVANGYISEVKNYEGGWGNVIRIVHFHRNQLYESLYAHCDSVLVSTNRFVKKGDQIATIGNCNGLYLAHLHFELRDVIGLDIGPGYATNTYGYLNPTDFITTNRN